MIVAENLSKIYPNGNEPFYALKQVSMTVADGEMVAIMGKSGAGKSTLLHVLGCLESFEEGRYVLDGQDVTALSARKLAKIRNEKIGFVMQDYSLLNQRSVLFNVCAPMLFNKTPYRQMKPLALAALDSVGVGDCAEKNVVNLSGGQRQRVAIARALVNGAPLILADEPTGNLDSRTAAEIMALFGTLHGQGKTILIVTHDEQVASYCDRTVRISDGILV